MARTCNQPNVTKSHNFSVSKVKRQSESFIDEVFDEVDKKELTALKPTRPTINTVGYNEMLTNKLKASIQSEG